MYQIFCMCDSDHSVCFTIYFMMKFQSDLLYSFEKSYLNSMFG